MSLTFFTILLRKVSCIEVISVRLFLVLARTWMDCIMRYEILAEAALSRFEPGNRLPWDVTVLFETHIKFFTVCFCKPTFVLLTLLIPASPLRKCFCRCAEIVLQTGCQVANRVTDVCGESVIHGIASKISRQRAGCMFVCSGEH
jgi:hypothetical protein